MQFLDLMVEQSYGRETVSRRAYMPVESGTGMPLWFRLMESAKALDRELYKATGHVLPNRVWVVTVSYVD